MAIAHRPRVALVDFDGHPVPDWVRPAIEAEGIDFVAQDCKTRGALAACAGEADVVWLLGGSPILQGGNLDDVPRCRAILRTGSGTDNVPVDEATRRDIVVANTPAAMSDGVSDQVIALLFAVIRRVVVHDRAVREGRWGRVPVLPVNGVQGRTLGLIGFGHAAREVARKLSGFEMRILAYDPFVTAETMAGYRVVPASVDEILSQSDYVSLHCALTPETRHRIGERELRSMKPSAILINTSRGPVIDEPALVRALSEGWIAGAGLDVFEAEPPTADNPLLAMDNVVVTPHVAGYAFNGLEARWRMSVETAIALAHGREPRSWVNRQSRKNR